MAKSTLRGYWHKECGQKYIREAKANPQVELVVVGDVDEAAVKQAEAEHRTRGSRDYGDLPKAETVDAVSIAVPHHVHYPIA